VAHAVDTLGERHLGQQLLALIDAKLRKALARRRELDVALCQLGDTNPR